MLLKITFSRRRFYRKIPPPLTTSTGTVELKNFEMAKYPVTNGWYKKFMDDNCYRKTEFWSGEGKNWLESGEAVNPDYWFDHKWNCPNAPVVGVSWYEADAFCRWLTHKRQDGYKYRLPAEKEWEAAAAGKQRREYPWGDEFISGRCNTRESGIDKTSTVGIFKDGDSPDVLSDISGNVWEWSCSKVDDKVKPDFERDELIMVRGGSWSDDHGDARCASRLIYFPDFRLNYVGFRCVRTK